MIRPLVLIALIFCATAHAAGAPVFAVGVEADARLVRGDAVLPERVSPDQVVFFDVVDGRPRRLGAVDAPVSFQGPPEAIVITPDRRWAFVPAANGRSASAPRTLVSLDVLSVIDLAGKEPHVVQTVHLGADATAAALSPDGGMLVVTHADGNSASILRVTRGHVEKIRQMSFAKGSRPLAATFLPDGHSLAVTFAQSNRIALFAWHGTTIEPRPYQEMSAGIYPASFAVCGRSGYAVVGSFGAASGDADTVSLIDLRAKPARVIDTASVGPQPEGLDCSDDGRFVVTANQNMSIIDPADPRYTSHSDVVLLAIRDRHLVVTDRAAIGAWAQGAMFVTADLVVAESIEDGRLHVFRRESDRLVKLDPVAFDHGGPAILGRARN